MLKWLLWIACVPLAAAVLIYGIGALLRADHVANGETLVAAPIGRVAAIVRDVERQPQWRSSVAAIEIVERQENAIRYVERSGSDAITFDFVEEVPGRRFRSTIADPDLPFEGFWTIALEPEGQSTRIRIEERGRVRSPIYRFFSTLVFGHEGTLRTYLADIGKATEGVTTDGAPSGSQA